ncbi:MAG: recombination protein RecR [Bacteroidales bacterium]|nr:recombination protein RecR [Candidatus Cacconaster scatequi]
MFQGAYSSQLLEEAVNQFASLPGIGRRTALRLALHILDEPEENVMRFTEAFSSLKRNIHVCGKCFMISDNEICPICDDRTRDRSTICVVENIRDVLSIENTGQYRGMYHILGGIISPIDGIGPSDLHIRELTERVKDGAVREVILALSTSMEGETTSYYLYKQISAFPVNVTTIARGVGFGDDLEYADELTLGKSIVNRHPFNTI